MPIATPQGTLDFKSVDKVTFVGASSNTVIDTTTGSLGVGVGVGGPTSNLHVVGNTRLEGDINMLHTANTASIKLNSNVVTEFPRSKKLIKYPRVALTSASYNAYESGYKVTRSNASNPSYQEWEAFDGMPGDGVGWYSGGSAGTEYNGTGGIYNGNTRLATETELGEWLGLELPESIKLQYLRLVSQSYSPVTNTIDDFILYAKKQSGDTWTSLGLFTGKAPAQNSPSGVIVNIDANDYYKFFAIVARKSAISSLGVSIRELEYYGVPEYDPEADGVDVVVKSTPNVPNTDLLEVYYDAKDLADGAVTTVDDLTPSGTNDGTATNVTVSDGAFVFNGTSSLMEKTSLSIPGGDNPLTFSFWIKSDDFDGNQYIIRLGDTQIAYQTVAIYKNPSNQIIFASWTLDFPINYTFTSNRWNHISLVYPGGGWKQSNLIAYVDGKSYTFGDNTSSGGLGGTVMSLATSLTLRLGAFVTGGDYFDGSIANFRLFNRALTSDEVWQLYAYQKEDFGHGDLGMTLKAGRLGIGTSEPRAALDVRGDVQVGGIITSNNPAFHVYRDAGDITTTDTTIVWNQVRFNRGNCYNSTTGVFHPPVDGMYYFSVFGMSDALTNAAFSFRFQYAPPNGSFDFIGALWPYQYVVASSSHIHASGSFVYFLEVGSQFRVLFHGTELLARGNSHNGYSGFLIG